ncbi:ubiquitin-related modifier 1 isoform X3 [Myotis myotis]|uniref:ubiquitin-related modifier 1 isoform X3 n=1 Tax=Myotis myotis TaxID=51298 RepID=UPI00174BB2FE|nr:ubiquitin-related modifier 1 isoform X3 [Myotis myotis]
MCLAPDLERRRTTVHSRMLFSWQQVHFRVLEALILVGCVAKTRLLLFLRGGAELLFDGVKKHQVTLPGQEEPWKCMQTLQEQSGILPPGLAGQRKVEGALQGPCRSQSVAASDQFPGLVDGGLSPNPAAVTVPPAACPESPLPLQAFRDIRNLLVWIKKNLLKERPELFIQGDSVIEAAPVPRQRRGR